MMKRTPEECDQQVTSEESVLGHLILPPTFNVASSLSEAKSESPLDLIIQRPVRPLGGAGFGGVKRVETHQHECIETRRQRTGDAGHKQPLRGRY